MMLKCNLKRNLLFDLISFFVVNHSFEFRLRVALGIGCDLMFVSRIRYTDTKPFTFTFAYHTYFALSDIRLANRFMRASLTLAGSIVSA